MIGLSTYAFFWQMSDLNRSPLGWQGLIDASAEFGAQLLQLCDFSVLDSISISEFAEVAEFAESRGLVLELGTRGVDSRNIEHYLELAEAGGISLLRTMVPAGAEAEAVVLLNNLKTRLEDSGISLSLETYEQVSVASLVRIVKELNSPSVGICLDPANCIAALEMPDDTIEACKDYVNNLHVKDFSFSRREGWVGFNLSGASLGQGLLDYPDLVRRIRPGQRGINQILEHWLPWQGSIDASCEKERNWTRDGLRYLFEREEERNDWQ